MRPVSDVVVVGGGQAGLAAARCLKRRGVDATVLDASPRVGVSWRNRYESLKLFTPAQYDSLPDGAFRYRPTRTRRSTRSGTTSSPTAASTRSTCAAAAASGQYRVTP